MTLVSPYYWLFLTIVIFLYYNAPAKLRWVILLISSLFFYLSIIPVYIIIIFYQAIIAFTFSSYLFKARSQKKILFFFGTFLSLLPLIFFKVFPIWSQTINSFFSRLFLNNQIENFQLAIPIGISFFTFTGLGYLIDVYNEKYDSTNNFGKVLLFISFFPIVLSGPIERGDFIEQFKTKHDLNIKKLKSGIILIIWGTFMKLVLADNIDLLIGNVLENPAKFSGKTILFSIFIFPFQVYGDLGGYSLIAIGSAKCFGLNVRQNFNNPFFATTMTDFWRRWHMSLISWINDYVFKPLNFYLRRFRKLGIVIGLFITFIIAGLWHSITFSFIIWGLFQATILSIEFIYKIKNDFFKKESFLFIRRIFIYILFSLSLIFGGAVSNLNNSLILVKKILNPLGDFTMNFRLLTICFFSILIILLKDYIDKKNFIQYLQNGYNFKIFKFVMFKLIILSILFFGVFKSKEFIYFQY